MDGRGEPAAGRRPAAAEGDTAERTQSPTSEPAPPPQPAGGISAAELEAMQARVDGLDEAILAACAEEDYETAELLETQRTQILGRIAAAEARPRA